MASYQDIDSRLKVVEDKIDFVMKAFTVTKREPSIISPGQFITQTKDLLSIYREARALGAQLISTEELNRELKKELDNGTDGTAQ